jgi:hypothetical protein
MTDRAKAKMAFVNKKFFIFYILSLPVIRGWAMMLP